MALLRRAPSHTHLRLLADGVELADDAVAAAAAEGALADDGRNAISPANANRRGSWRSDERRAAASLERQFLELAGSGGGRHCYILIRAPATSGKKRSELEWMM